MDFLTSEKITECLISKGQINEPDSKDEGVRKDFLQQLSVFSQELIEEASSLPQEDGYVIQASDNENAKIIRDSIKELSESLFMHAQNACCPKTVLHKLHKSPDLCDSYEDFSNIMEYFLSKVEIGLKFCQENGMLENIKSMGGRDNLLRDSQNQKTNLCTQNKNNIKTTQPKNSYSPLNRNREFPYSSDMLWKRDNTVFFHAFYQIERTNLKWMSELSEAPLRNWELIMRRFMKRELLENKYKNQIKKLDWENIENPEGKLDLFSNMEVIEYLDMRKTPLVIVDTEERLEMMINEISSSNCREIAIDVEHHSVQSYLGITCLIQLSTREKDYIIDPLHIRESLFKLNILTTDRGILKVLHGGRHDVLWLQRDFSVFLVNIFDTFIAASKLPEITGFALAYLVNNYCGVKLEKKFQLADWRKRPLPAEMLKYARSDTHYLLYIYDRMRVALLESNPALLKEVLYESREISSASYNILETDLTKMARVIYSKMERNMTELQQKILVNLLRFRENAAWFYDENPQNIFSTKLLVRIAEKAPETWTELRVLSNPLPKILSENAQEVICVIKACKNNRQSSSDKPEEVTLNSKPSELEVLANTEGIESALSQAGSESLSIKSILPTAIFSLEQSLENRIYQPVNADCPEVSVVVYSTVKKRARENILKDKIPKIDGTKDASSPSKLRNVADGFQILLAQEDEEYIFTHCHDQPVFRLNHRVFANLVETRSTLDYLSSSVKLLDNIAKKDGKTPTKKRRPVETDLATDIYDLDYIELPKIEAKCSSYSSKAKRRKKHQ